MSMLDGVAARTAPAEMIAFIEKKMAEYEGKPEMLKVLQEVLAEAKRLKKKVDESC